MESLVEHARLSVNGLILPERMIVRLWRVMHVWHESIRQCPQDIGRTLIACNTRHSLTG